ncbi:MAG TPA: MFS transporter [Bryobacteraceae bacterium]|nr:MFS transporter [Bryobacteraceae bacterium]
MQSTVSSASSEAQTSEAFQHTGEKMVFGILLAAAFCHFLNDMVQSLIPAIYPLLKVSFHLDFGQVGIITLTYQITASLLQPLIGHFNDRHPRPYSLAIGMGFTLIGLITLSRVTTYPMLLCGAAMVGIGSAVFHPESSRVVRTVSGGQHGFAQAFFQVGGNAGSSLGPLLAAFIVLPNGRSSLAWFSAVTLLGIIVLARVGSWSKRNRLQAPKKRAAHSEQHPLLSSRKVYLSLAVLIALMFSKFFYLSSLNSYYTFYLMSKFHLPIRSAQIHLFLFAGSIAAGTIIGGPIGDRFGRKYVIWCSILGVLPFTLMLPYSNLFWTSILTVVIGVILASAFSAILVYAQELMPGKIGMISGMFFGLAFGMAGVGAALLGQLADHTSIAFVYKVCSFLPAIGLLTGFLPNLESRKRRMVRTVAETAD